MKAKHKVERVFYLDPYAAQTCAMHWKYLGIRAINTEPTVQHGCKCHVLTGLATDAQLAQVAAL